MSQQVIQNTDALHVVLDRVNGKRQERIHSRKKLKRNHVIHYSAHGSVTFDQTFQLGSDEKDDVFLGFPNLTLRNSDYTTIVFIGLN